MNLELRIAPCSFGHQKPIALLRVRPQSYAFFWTHKKSKGRASASLAAKNLFSPPKQAEKH
jgi:hypothetical protein